MPTKITIPGEDGEEDRWIQVRDTKQRFKAGERRKLYEVYAEVEAQRGKQMADMALMRTMACHLVHSWSLEVPPPRAEMVNGGVVYSNANSLDELDVDMENELFGICAQWVKQISVNFGASTNPESPTEPSGG